MKSTSEIRPFESCIAPVKYPRKIQTKDFLDSGTFPIISQEAQLISGYWNNDADVFRVSTPVVIFGDHTQVFKYVDFDFVLGADGVKILQPREFLLPKFFFYQLLALELPSLGYARHYRMLKSQQIQIPPKPEQQRLIVLLDEAFKGITEAKANAERKLAGLEALKKSLLHQAIAGNL